MLQRNANLRHRQKDAKKLMQLDLGQKDQIRAAGAENRLGR
jgi:hypothetical protein